MTKKQEKKNGEIEKCLLMAANNENVSNGNYTWPDGTCSPIPPDFAFPQCKLLAAWKFWNSGHKYNGDNFRKKVIAFKDLTSSMFKTLKKERKKYSKWVIVMRFITEKKSVLSIFLCLPGPAIILDRKYILTTKQSREKNNFYVVWCKSLI